MLLRRQLPCCSFESHLAAIGFHDGSRYIQAQSRARDSFIEPDPPAHDEGTIGLAHARSVILNQDLQVAVGRPDGGDGYCRPSPLSCIVKEVA
jgi:hypothetical protein